MPRSGFLQALNEIADRFEARWECLRRNSEYQHDWKTFQSRFDSWFKKSFGEDLAAITGPGTLFEIFKRVSENEQPATGISTDVDEQAYAEFRRFLVAGGMKWGCNWFCSPSFDRFDIVLESAECEYVIEQFGRVPLVNIRPPQIQFDPKINLFEFANDPNLIELQ
jgi:hypothetical protein